jgi:GTPase involved in cell partitioning and DNA repair
MFVAILGDRKVRLPADWTSETVLALAAEADFDATSGAGPAASITFVGVGGDLVVRVPPGSRVRESGFSLLGDRRIEVADGDGPEIQVKVWSLFSDVKVTDR